MNVFSSKFFLIKCLLLIFNMFYMGLTVALAADDGISVQATVNTNSVSVGQAFQLNISVKSKSRMSGLGEPRLPDLQGFDLVSRTQSTVSRMSIINGDMHPEVEQQYHYVLIPQKAGSLKIGEAEVNVDGKSYVTKPIVVTVVPAGQTPKGQANRQKGKPSIDDMGDENEEVEDLFTQILRRRGLLPGMGMPGAPDPGGPGQMQGGNLNPNDAFFIRVSVDKTQAFVGEQITASWYIYTRNLIRDIDTLKYPDLKAFWKEDIEVSTRLNFQDEVINGVPYKKALLVSYALFPLKEGTATIDPYKAKCTVSMGGWSGFGQTYTFTKAAPEVKIKVLPIPVEGQPKDFTGGVGQFSVKASVTAQKIQTGQPFSFKVRVEGRGNAKGIDVPPLELPKSLESFDTKTETKFFPTGESFKEFEFLLIPREAGTLNLPAVSVSAFDPKEKRFVSRSSDPIQVQVFQGNSKDNPESRPGKIEGGKEKSQKKNNSLPGIDINWKPMLPVPLVYRVYGYCLLLVVLLIYLIVRLRMELGYGQKQRNRKTELERRLRILKQKCELGDFRAAGAEGLNAFYAVLGDASTEGKASVSLDKLLLKIPPSLRKEVEKPLGEIVPVFEALSFAPESFVGEYKSKQKLLEAADKLEKILRPIVSHNEIDNFLTGQKVST